MSSPEQTASPGPLELIESARSKYILAQARARRGPPELALLSIHGSLEDALRAHGLRLQLPEAYEPFPQLLEALTAVDKLPLSSAEAEGIRRMHRLRARVAHGEQIAVTAETLQAYHRLATRLLSRYGIVVAAPEPDAEAPPGRQPATATTVPARRGDTAVIHQDTPGTRRRGDTAALDRNLVPAAPRRERTVYPDDRPARYAGRVAPSAATRDLPLARELMVARRRPGRGGGLDAFWDGSQRWLLPVIIVTSIFLIGIVISTSLGQLRGEAVAPTAALAVTPQANAPALVPTADPAILPTADPALAPTPATNVSPPPNTLAVGTVAYVRADAGALNVRQRPGLAADNPIQVELGPGTAVQIVGGPVEADGMTWWQVRAASAEGWCAGQFLEAR